MTDSTDFAARLARAAPQLLTLSDWVRWGASRLTEADVTVAHGFDSCVDEALALVLHATSLAHNPPPEFWAARVDDDERAHLVELFRARIVERRPVAYLTGHAWFGDYAYRVTPDVLIPRSSFAELIERQFAPWLRADPDDDGRIADIGTGSGCIAIACAMAFPGARVDAVDVSSAALEVAARNVAEFGLDDRMSLLQGNLLEPLEGRYQLIVSNPPYVDAETMAALAPEHRHEPSLGLAAGEDGLDCVRAILERAPEHLAHDGLLAVEVGESRPAFEAAFPDLPVAWPGIERGADGGIFVVAAADLGAR